MVWSSEMSARPSRYRSDLNFAMPKSFVKRESSFRFRKRDVHIRDGVIKLEKVAKNEMAERSEA